jgi:hypothetical protein
MLIIIYKNNSIYLTAKIINSIIILQFKNIMSKLLDKNKVKN